jgi:hypothetical protein
MPWALTKEEEEEEEEEELRPSVTVRPVKCFPDFHLIKCKRQV